MAEATLADVVTVSASGLSAALALAFAFVVWRSNPEARSNRRLAGLLVCEAFLQGTLAVSIGFGLRPTIAGLVVPWLGLTAASVAYLLFVTTLDGRLARAARGNAARAAAILVPVAVLVGSLYATGQAVRRGATAEVIDDDVGWPWAVFAIASILALVVSLDAYRASARGTSARRRAGAYSLAFGVRDGLYAAIVVAWALGEWVLHSDPLQDATQLFTGVIPLLFIPLLAYGILSTQLFDIDLKIKVGISRSTVASIALAVVFVVSKVVESYASRNLGFVAGAVAAGLLLFAAPRLNKLGDKVANTAMPQVQPTSQYVAYKKLEVYRAAVESALEGDQRIDAAERAMLDRMRVKLGLAEEDAKALEAEMVGA